MKESKYMIISSDTGLYLLDTTKQEVLITVSTEEGYRYNNRVCGFGNKLFYAKWNNRTSTNIYDIETKQSVEKDLKGLLDKDYAGIDCFGDKYLVVTYDNSEQVLLLDHTKEDLPIAFTLNIKSFTINSSSDDCCVVNE